MAGVGSHSALVQVSIRRKQCTKSCPMQRLLRLCREQDVPPVLLSPILLCPEFHYEVTAGEANLSPIAVDYHQGKGALFPAVWGFLLLHISLLEPSSTQGLGTGEADAISKEQHSKTWASMSSCKHRAGVVVAAVAAASVKIMEIIEMHQILWLDSKLWLPFSASFACNGSLGQVEFFITCPAHMFLWQDVHTGEGGRVTD